MKDLSISEQIEAIIKSSGDWRGKTMSELRSIIKESDPEIVEEVKWKMHSNPLGVPVWSHDGIICVGNILKNRVRLTFFNGAKLKDPKKIFNTRLDSKTVRAVDFYENDHIDEAALKSLIKEAIELK